ncbi:MAG: YdcF family protein, partial [Candidatus Acidiferrales bacterium]
MEPHINPAFRRRPFHLLYLGFLILAALLAAGIVVFRGIGKWLVLEDPLEHADVIVVLSGRIPARAMEAAQIYRQGFAPEVWVTHPDGPKEELAQLGIDFTDEDVYSAEILEKLGVPADRIHILPKPILNTEEEIETVKETLEQTGKSRAIIVTSPSHTRRVRALWRVLAGRNLRAMVRYARSEPYDAAHWWRHTRDALSVLRETLGLLNAWAGLPVRPLDH